MDAFAVVLLVLVLGAGGTLTPAAASAGDPHIGFVPFVSGLSRPVAIASPGDGTGRLMVAEQAGRIRTVSSGVLLEEPFLDIGGPSGVITCCGERGLLGLVFSPRFSETGAFYVFYSDLSSDVTIARYRVFSGNPLVADPSSAEILVTVQHRTSNLHYGGQLAFGPDGLLYAGLGDGGSPGDEAGNAQNPDSLLGKIIRMDVESAQGPYTPEIYALGLRNPWRFSFDAVSHTLSVADVGQSTFEEINAVDIASVGHNFGWPIMEGSQCFAAPSCDETGLTAPTIEYAHSEGCAVIGGYVYRGVALPSQTARYFYGDFCSGRVWGGSNQIDSGLALSTFGRDDDGELYVADLYTGVLYKLAETSRSLALVQQPVGSTVGSALAVQPAVAIVDASGETVVGDSVSLVSLSLHEPGDAVLSCTDGLTRQVTDGVAMFQGCTISAPGTYTLLATSAPEVMPVTTVPIEMTSPPGTTGLLRVTTSPGVPSQVQVNGIPMDDWALNWVDLPVGTYTVSFSDVRGFTTPAPQTVVLTADQVTAVQGNFVQRGNLRVVTSPPVPSTVLVDGIPRNDWGLWTDLPTGSYQVCFGAVQGFNTPSCQQANLVAGQATVITGTFTVDAGAPGPAAGFGLLRVQTSPAVPSQVLVNGVPMTDWGLDWVKLPPGTYTVSFGNVSSFTGPPPQVVTLVEDQVTSVTGTFSARGFLRVVTSPSLPGTIIVDGLHRNKWQVWTSVEPGDFDVCFGVDPNGWWETPSCQQLSVSAGNLSTVTGIYGSPPRVAVEIRPYDAGVHPSITIPGIFSGPFVFSGRFGDGPMVFIVPEGEYTVCFGAVPGWNTPPCALATAASGELHPVRGTYTPVQFGNLRVVTSPPVPSTIMVDGIPRNDWGMWTDVPVGTHQVCFGAVEGFDAPPCQDVTLSVGETKTVTGTFVTNPNGPGPEPGYGLLRVQTSPAVPSQISVNGIPMSDWGLDWVKLPPGTCTVSFGDVSNFTSPPPQVVTVTADQTTLVTGTFQ